MLHFGDSTEESPTSKPVQVSVGPYHHQNRLERNRERDGDNHSVGLKSEVYNSRLTT